MLYNEYGLQSIDNSVGIICKGEKENSISLLKQES